MDGEDHSSEVDAEEATSNARHQAPYSTHHPIPTVQHYKEIRRERDRLDDGGSEANRQHRGQDGVKGLFKLTSSGSGEGDVTAQGWADQSYNRNLAAIGDDSESVGEGVPNADRPPQDSEKIEPHGPDGDSDGENTSGNDENPVDTSEAISNEANPRKKRKAMKGRAPEKDTRSRKVTDPITHLPVTIHDFTTKELQDAPGNLPLFGTEARTATGVNAASKDEEQLKSEEEEIERGTAGMQKLFPPPSFDVIKEELGGAYKTAFSVCATAIGIIGFSTFGAAHFLIDPGSTARLMTATVVFVAGAAVSAICLWVCRGWLTSKIDAIWQDDVWDAARLQERRDQRKLQIPESVMWLNSIVASIWPLINPDLFASLVDTLEDVMQASLPKVVRMIAIEDFGQGKSAVRILGLRWLPSGAAAQSVSKDGKVKSHDKEKSDREDPDRGQLEKSEEKSQDQHSQKSEQKESEDDNLAEGLEAEAGDFLNMELSFSYRATAKGKSLKKKNENAHMYLVFYLPASMFRIRV